MSDVLANDLLSAVAIPGFTGRTLAPGQIGYDDARRVFNGMIDRRPALIARCTSDEDVAAVVRHAVATGQPVSVYGGGHGVTGSAVADGGVCIDLRGMKQGLGDASSRTVRASARLTWGELDEACQAHGLAGTRGPRPPPRGGGPCPRRGRGRAGRSPAAASPPPAWAALPSAAAAAGWSARRGSPATT